MATAPTVIGRYQVVRRLGTGGMGSVFLALDPDLDRHVAIKLVKDDLTDDPELRERFSREARSAARLRHPNIVTVFDIGEHEGRPFIAMEYVPGESLSDIVKRKGPLDLGRVLGWMESLCSGLSHAHRSGIVHRDIKPANMMVDAEGTLKIVDFGIARLADSHMTREGVLVGTINYMAPEQILGAAADHRADVFAVGAVFFELLSFQKAFPGTIADGLFTRICHDAPPPLDQVCPGLDPGIVAVVYRALDKDPARRYHDLAGAAREIAAIRTRLKASGELGATVTIATADLPMMSGPASTPYSGSRAGVGFTPAPQATDPSLQRILIELEQARDRTAKIKTSLERARQALAEGQSDAALRAAEEVLAVDPTVGEARDIVQQVKTAREERQRQAAADAARRIIDAARDALEAGDDRGALELLDAVKAPNDSLAALVGELRARIADVQKQRSRRAAIFIDGAELAIAKGEFAKAAPLLDDAARVDPTLPAIAALRAQVETALAAAREADQKARDLDAALRDANAALARGDFGAARELAQRALAVDPQSWQAGSLLGRIQQAERSAQQRAQQQDLELAQAARGGSTKWIVIGLALVAVAVVLYVVFGR
ncbi:MAG: protein kinase [Vicinamibacterales bacterium]|nr:protein kinase [Vicinamibacterales bacterium]